MTEAANAFLFRGEARAYWRLLARGADARSVVHLRRGSRRHDFGLDGAGMACRNGGIANPQERTLGAGRVLYRFVGTAAWSRDGAKAGFGRWWLDADTWQLLRDAARTHQLSMERTAQLYLALPDEWGDRGRVVRGQLVQPLQVWTGTGLVAADSQGGTVTPAQHNRAVQLFAPGDPGVIGQAFGGIHAVDCRYTRDCPPGW